MPVALRPLAPADGERLARFHPRLSEDTVYRRYHGLHPRLSERDLAYLVSGVDQHDHLAWVACDDEGEFLGVCRVIRAEPGGEDAEIAIVVADAAQGRGVGRALLERVMREARAAGIRMLDAVILATNTPALKLFMSTADRLAVPWLRTHSGGVVRLKLDLSGLV
jgi:ribosomal protein S18 acetylase RimI-like enzyme